MDIKHLQSTFLAKIRRFRMSYSNAMRVALKWQHQLDITRDRCDHYGDGTCHCTGYHEGLQGACTYCGDPMEDHPAQYPTTVYKSIVEQYVAKPYELTIAIYSHGCDKPFPLFEGHALQPIIVPRVQMLSAVSHSCFNYGSSDTYLTMLQEVYRDHSIDQYTALEQVKQHMNPHVQALQRVPHELGVQDQREAVYRDHFVSLPAEEIYRVHKPSTDREYNFVKDADDLKENKQFGIYIVHSTLPDDDIAFSYVDPVKPLSQANNILSAHVSPSLRKYTDLFYQTMRVGSIDVISLQDILFCFFRRVQWDTVRVIDLGCRATCVRYAAPALRRLSSVEITDLENQPLTFGGKKNKKNSKNDKTKKKKSKKKKNSHTTCKIKTKHKKFIH